MFRHDVWPMGFDIWRRGFGPELVLTGWSRIGVNRWIQWIRTWCQVVCIPVNVRINRFCSIVGISKILGIRHNLIIFVPSTWETRLVEIWLQIEVIRSAENELRHGKSALRTSGRTMAIFTAAISFWYHSSLPLIGGWSFFLWLYI